MLTGCKVRGNGLLADCHGDATKGTDRTRRTVVNMQQLLRINHSIWGKYLPQIPALELMKRRGLRVTTASPFYQRCVIISKVKPSDRKRPKPQLTLQEPTPATQALAETLPENKSSPEELKTT